MIVVDCSVLVDAMVAVDAEELGDRLTDLRLTAPVLIDFELVAAVRGLVLGRLISQHRAEEILADYERMPITRWSFADDLRRRAFQLRDNITACDAAYVVLAESLDCPLMTRDRRLAAAADRLVEVIVV